MSSESEHSEIEKAPKRQKTSEKTEKVEKVEKKVAKWCPRQLFVSGISYDSKEADLKTFFGVEGVGDIKMPVY